MMKQFRFYYHRTSLHKVQLFALGGFALVMLSFALLAVAKLPDASGADVQVFLFLALGMGLPALALLYFAVWYYRRVRDFFKSEDWHGITLSGKNLHCIYFDMLRTIEWEVNLDNLVTAFKGTSRGGRRWICIKCTDTTKFIPTGLLRENDPDNLLMELKKYEKPV
ncbi:MAG: hypothetical protein U0X40_04470 [Ferruginibacter sp.]